MGSGVWPGWRLFGLVVLRLYLDHPLRAVRNLGIMTAVAAGIFYFAAIMPAYSFYYTAPYARASFATVSTVPAPSLDLEATLHAEGRGVRPIIVWDAGNASVIGPAGRVEGLSGRALEHSSSESLSDTFYSPGLLDAVVPKNARGVVLDTTTARRVGASVGHVVRIDWETQGVSAVGSIDAELLATALPTSETQGVLLVGYSEGFPVLGAQVFVPTAKASALDQRRVDGGAPLNGRSREQALSEGLSRLEEMLPRNTRFLLIWVSLCMYGGFLWWEQSDRLTDRRKRHAILISLGLGERELAQLLLVEQVLLGFTTAILGCIAGGWLLTGVTGMYLPPDTLAAISGYALIVNAAVGFALGALANRRMHRLPTARLLTQE